MHEADLEARLARLQALDAQIERQIDAAFGAQGRELITHAKVLVGRIPVVMRDRLRAKIQRQFKPNARVDKAMPHHAVRV